LGGIGDRESLMSETMWRARAWIVPNTQAAAAAVPSAWPQMRWSKAKSGATGRTGVLCCWGTDRGFSAVSLLLVDEASRVEDELYDAVRRCSRFRMVRCGC
jgi:hypothetical protein